MKALVHSEKDTYFQLEDITDPEPSGNEKTVALKAAALNRRDFYITRGLYPGIKYPVVLGSDGAGICEGNEVIINPAIGWGDSPDYPSSDFQILGMPRQGTFAEKICIPAKQLYDKPGHLSFEEAAALPLAGLTAYRALFTKGHCQQGQRVLINGIGGGVATMAFVFAKATGASVHVTSSSHDKRKDALQRGAAGAYDYTHTSWWKPLKDDRIYFDVIIDSAGGSGFADLVNITAPGGRIVTYGGTRGKIDGLSPQLIFWRQLQILGTSMGNDLEFRDMIAFVNDHKIHPIVDKIYSLSDGKSAMKYMAAGHQHGKVVLSI